MSETTQDKIMFQYIMNYKAHRRYVLITRLGTGLVVAGGLAGLCAVSILIGIVLALIALCFCGIAVIVAYGAEQTYTVYTDRIVLKVRGVDKRKTVQIKDITSVGYKRAFYEQSLMTGTLTLIARTEGGKTKKYKLKHIAGAGQAMDYINGCIRDGNPD